MKLVQRFDCEKAIGVKCAMASCLNAFLGAENFAGKRLFLKECKGIDFMSKQVV